MLDQASQRALIELATSSIQATVRGGPGPEDWLIDDLMARHEPLGLAGAAFATLYVGDELRGCLGEISRVDPLARVVIFCAGRAARFDLRFDPVRPEELVRLRFTISVLGPLAQVSNPEQIVIGRDGLLLEQDERRGLLLPDVAVERGWGRAEFIDHLYLKAGIDPSTPLLACRLWSFRTQVIHSPNFPAPAPVEE